MEDRMRHIVFTSAAGLILFLSLVLPPRQAAGQVPAIEPGYAQDGNINVDIGQLLRLTNAWLAEQGQAKWNAAAELELSHNLTFNSEDPLAAAEDEEQAEIPFENITVEPAGGTYSFGQGASLELPPGAVSENGTISVRTIPQEQVTPYLSQGPHEKRYLAAVEFGPGVRLFNQPIGITLPAEPLVPGEDLPYQFYLNRQTGMLIPYLPAPAPARMNAEGVLMADANPIGRYFEVDCAAGELGIRDLTDFPPEDWILVMAAMNKILEHSDCIEEPCRCCKFRVRSKDTDFYEKDRCTNVSAKGDIEYLDCPNQPKESWDMDEPSIKLFLSLTGEQRLTCNQQSVLLETYMYDVNGYELPEHPVTVTSSNEGLLTVQPQGIHQFLLVRVGEETGVVTVTADAGCDIKEQITVQVGCEIPDLTGSWTVIGTETWWDCNDPEDNGVYTEPGRIEFDSQVELTPYSASFAGSYEYTEFTEDYTLYYEEHYGGTISVDCRVTDRCSYKVSGSSSYTETYFFPESEPDDEPYVVTGIDTFSGHYNNGVITLTTLGMDTSGDTCQTSGNVTLTR